MKEYKLTPQEFHGKVYLMQTPLKTNEFLKIGKEKLNE